MQSCNYLSEFHLIIDRCCFIISSMAILGCRLSNRFVSSITNEISNVERIIQCNETGTIDNITM